MKRITSPVIAIAVFCCCGLVACGGGGTSTSSATQRTPTSISISPSQPSFLVTATQQFTATATYSDGSTSDITNSANWQVVSDIPGLTPVTRTSTTAASIQTAGGTTPGMATGVAAGPITVTATVNGVSGSATGFVNATPLISMTSSETYKGFEGGLYEGGSSTVTDAKHDADGIAAAALIQPLDMNGTPSSISGLPGKIVVVGIGMSNWTDELCLETMAVAGTPCDSFTFIGQAGMNPTSDTVLVDCAISGQVAENWTNNDIPPMQTAGNYTNCENLLSAYGLTAKQVQVILWMDADGHPGSGASKSFSSLTNAQGQTPSQYCAAHVHTPPGNGDVDACAYMEWVAESARYAKKNYFPNVQQMFLHSRTYAGYATSDLNPEPFAYEYGFATKWLIQAQIDQANGMGQDPTAGALDYTVALNPTGSVPWMAWGPYFWASGMSPRTDSEVTGLPGGNLIWVPSDFKTSDYTHPSAGDTGGRMKVATIMKNWYASSPYTIPWFTQ